MDVSLAVMVSILVLVVIVVVALLIRRARTEYRLRSLRPESDVVTDPTSAGGHVQVDAQAAGYAAQSNRAGNGAWPI